MRKANSDVSRVIQTVSQAYTHKTKGMVEIVTTQMMYVML